MTTKTLQAQRRAKPGPKPLPRAVRKTEICFLRLDLRMKNSIKRDAKRLGITQSDFIRRAVGHFGGCSQVSSADFDDA